MENWQLKQRQSLPLEAMGESNTGCIYCMYGVHLEGKENRFTRMAKSHPKLYKYCIEDLGLGKVLDYIKVPYRVYEDGTTEEVLKDGEGKTYCQLKI